MHWWVSAGRDLIRQRVRDHETNTSDQIGDGNIALPVEANFRIEEDRPLRLRCQRNHPRLCHLSSSGEVEVTYSRGGIHANRDHSLWMEYCSELSGSGTSWCDDCSRI